MLLLYMSQQYSVGPTKMQEIVQREEFIKKE